MERDWQARWSLGLKPDAPEATKGFLLNHLIHELLPPKGDGLRWANSIPSPVRRRGSISGCGSKSVDAPDGLSLPHADDQKRVVAELARDLTYGEKRTTDQPARFSTKRSSAL
ncbi:MAG: hypothetical protein R3D29_15825 [Nitratireductor sp.]